MKRPDTFKFGILKYKIKWRKRVKDKQGNDLGGWHKQHKSLIIINTEDDEQFQKIVVMHEIVHAIARGYGMTLKENEIDGIAQGMIEALHRNEWMGRYWNED